MAPPPSVKRSWLGFQLACWFLVAPARAQWLPGGVPLCTSPQNQDGPVITTDGSGGAIVAWRDYRDTGVDSDIYSLRINALGLVAAGWPVGGLPICVALGSQEERVVEADGVGGAYVAWTDFRDDFTTSMDVYLQRVTGEGVIASGWAQNGYPVCTAAGDARLSRIASDGVGGVFVVWQDYRRATSSSQSDTSQVDLYVQRITPAGEIAPGWPAGGRPLRTAPGSVYGVSLLRDGLGGLFVVWGDARDFATAGYDIYALRITSQGDPAAGWPSDGLPLCTAPGYQWDARLVPDDEGGFFVAWDDARSTPPGDPNYPNYADIYASRVTATGTIASGWPQNGLALCTANLIQWYPKIVSDGTGGAIVVWGDYRNYFDFGTAEDIYAQRVLAEGAIAPGWSANGVPVSRAAGWQRADAVVADGAGGALLAFETTFGAGGRLFGQRLSSEGTIAPGWNPEGEPLCSVQSLQERAVAVSDGKLGMIVAWEDGRGPEPRDIYAQRVGSDGVTPVQISLVSVAALPDRVTLAWYRAEGALADATVYRRREGEEWAVLGRASFDGTGRLEFEDRTVAPGARYAYRLGWSEAGGERFSAETWVEVPAALALTLEGARPNPAVGPLSVAFTLPRSQPASLELLDVGGRRVLAQEVGSLGAGRHLVRLDDTRGTPPGMYWLRLSQGERSVTSRVAVMR